MNIQSVIEIVLIVVLLYVAVVAQKYLNRKLSESGLSTSQLDRMKSLASTAVTFTEQISKLIPMDNGDKKQKAIELFRKYLIESGMSEPTYDLLDGIIEEAVNKLPRSLKLFANNLSNVSKSD